MDGQVVAVLLSFGVCELPSFGDGWPLAGWVGADRESAVVESVGLPLAAGGTSTFGQVGLGWVDGTFVLTVTRNLTGR